MFCLLTTSQKLVQYLLDKCSLVPCEPSPCSVRGTLLGKALCVDLLNSQTIWQACLTEVHHRSKHTCI